MRESETRTTPGRANHHSATVWEFVDCINRGDPDALADRMTAQHLLVDSLGVRIRGRNAARRAWAGYFSMVPAYRIRIEEMLTDGNTTVLLGSARGGYVPPRQGVSVGRWSTPAAWRAVVRRGLVAEWQVYADNEPIRQLARRGSRRSRPTIGADEALLDGASPLNPVLCSTPGCLLENLCRPTVCRTQRSCSRSGPASPYQSG